LLRVTHFLSSAENLKHFCFGSLIRLFSFSFSLWSLRLFT